MRQSFDLAAYHLAQVHRFAGTITDISEIGRIEPGQGPAISPAAYNGSGQELKTVYGQNRRTGKRCLSGTAKRF